jgi:hypothetical protein
VLLGVLVGCLRHVPGSGLFLCVVSFGRLLLRWVVHGSGDVDALGPLGGIGALWWVVLERMRVVFADRWLEGSAGLSWGVLLVGRLGRFVRFRAAELLLLQVRL